eukprot:TRINITY_DN7113_c0_g1_i1.p1 TRINITY_DN7113_c0_g1~~TRINITY_DN7113_c0_g1_i1.p1  ORF type:complete len:200 (-),score=27.06 TRINITY_DN7113_c0_g1_i1:232-831(-)
MLVSSPSIVIPRASAPHVYASTAPTAFQYAPNTPLPSARLYSQPSFAVPSHYHNGALLSSRSVSSVRMLPSTSYAQSTSSTSAIPTSPSMLAASPSVVYSSYPNIGTLGSIPINYAPVRQESYYYASTPQAFASPLSRVDTSKPMSLSRATSASKSRPSSTTALVPSQDIRLQSTLRAPTYAANRGYSTHRGIQFLSPR